MQNKTPNFKYIKHHEIDSEKWNRCIDNALNCRVYAYDWHLDRTAKKWDALIWKDYEYVMPLPIRKKFGIKYIYQPLFSQQLGIFPSPIKQVSEAFFKYLYENFRYTDVNLNSENIPIKEPELVNLTKRNNFLLSLSKDYNTLAESFSKNTKRNISKANKNGLTLVKGIRLEEYLEFKAGKLQTGVNKNDLSALKSLVSFGHYKGFGQIYGVYTNSNQLCAAVYFCRWKDRVIYFNAASNEEGKEVGGMYFLINKFLEENAGTNLTLDFEGSMIPGVARFYAGFGAIPETYFQLKFNRLPLPLRWLKR